MRHLSSPHTTTADRAEGPEGTRELEDKPLVVSLVWLMVSYCIEVASKGLAGNCTVILALRKQHPAKGVSPLLAFHALIRYETFYMQETQIFLGLTVNHHVDISW